MDVVLGPPADPVAPTEAGWRAGARRIKGMLCGRKEPPVCDQTQRERRANVLTSLPFVWLGARAARIAGLGTGAAAVSGRRYGASLAGVGAVATAYHLARGETKAAFRAVDYGSIAASLACMLRAAKPGAVAPAWSAASAVGCVVHPLAAAGANAAALELQYAKAAVRNPARRAAFTRHLGVGAVAAAFFVTEEVFPQVPFLHAAWHLSAAAAVMSLEQGILPGR